MSEDFISRLERELRQAAEREERARRRLRFRLPRVQALGRVREAFAPALVAAAVLAVAIVIAVDAPREREVSEVPGSGLGPVPAAVQGSYTRAGDAALILDPDGYTVESPSTRIAGSAAAQPDLLVLESPARGECSGRGDGRYLLRATPDRLELSVLADGCTARRELLAGVWSRG